MTSQSPGLRPGLLGGPETVDVEPWVLRDRGGAVPKGLLTRSSMTESRFEGAEEKHGWTHSGEAARRLGVRDLSRLIPSALMLGGDWLQIAQQLVPVAALQRRRSRTGEANGVRLDIVERARRAGDRRRSRASPRQ